MTACTQYLSCCLLLTGYTKPTKLPFNFIRKNSDDGALYLSSPVIGGKKAYCGVFRCCLTVSFDALCLRFPLALTLSLSRMLLNVRFLCLIVGIVFTSRTTNIVLYFYVRDSNHSVPAYTILSPRSVHYMLVRDFFMLFNLLEWLPPTSEQSGSSRMDMISLHGYSTFHPFGMRLVESKIRTD